MSSRALRMVALAPLAAFTACTNPNFSELSCKDVEADTCVEVDPEDPETSLLDVVNSLSSNTTVVLGSGTFSLDNQVTIRGADGVTLVGQGMNATVLDFGAMTVQANGVDAIAEGFTIEGVEILDAPKDGLRVEDSVDVVIRGVRATWSNEDDPSNGGYGLYPVRSDRVLIENSEASNASDAGIYVGQCVEAVVRNNLATKNVAGLEIENTAYADVYGNTVTDNTGGLVVFDLPGNPVIGRDVKIHDNSITDNNRANFAPGGTVALIPAGTGTFAMASRRVEITNNTYANNDSVDIALISGLVVDSDPEKWAIPSGDIVNDITGLVLDEGDGVVMNYRSSEIYVHGNSHSGSGTAPDGSDREARELGFLLDLAWGTDPVDTVLYDSIGESSFDADVAANNSNDNHICVGADPGVTFASMNLGDLPAIPTTSAMFQPEAPFTPFDCDAFTEGPLVMPTFAD